MTGPDSENTAAADTPEEPLTTAADPAAEGETQSINAWSLADDDAIKDVAPYHQRSWKVPIALSAGALVALVGVGLVVYKVNDAVDHSEGQRHRDEVVGAPAASTPLPPAAPSCVKLGTLDERVKCQVAANNSSPAATPTPAPTSAPPSKTKFFGEWGNHFMNVTLAPDGSARYSVYIGAMSGSSWSATWSAMDGDRAMIVLTNQLEQFSNTGAEDFSLHRYPGQAFTFTVETDGYATITDPEGKPRPLCPREQGFHDTDGRCGA